MLYKVDKHESIYPLMEILGAAQTQPQPVAEEQGA